MADGSSKAIQDIQIGDSVVAYDVFLQKQSVSPVTYTFVRPDDRHKVIEYEVVDG